MERSVIIILFVLLIGCKRNNDAYQQIPNVAINETVYLSQPQFFDLGVVNGWVYLNSGSKGIILFRKSLDEFKAYERHSPFQSTASCAIINVDSVNLVGVEQCENSTYSLQNGTVLSGPASLPLLEYQVTKSGDVLQIIN